MNKKLNLIAEVTNPQTGKPLALTNDGKPLNYQTLLLHVINNEPLQGRDAAFRVQLGNLGKLVGRAEGELILDKAQYDALKGIADATNALNAAGWQALTEFIDGAETVE